MCDSSAGDVTRLLADWAAGNQEALDRLLPLVYAELRRLAGAYVRGDQPGHTLNATALVHEVFLRLIDQSAQQCKGRAHFLAIAGRLMRQVLVDAARARH